MTQKVESGRQYLGKWGCIDDWFGRTLILQKVQSHRFDRNAGFIRQDVKLRGSAAA
jgi:hypothetical protein